MQLELFDTVDVGTIELEDIFSAYYECRKNKRRTINALAFEADFEENLIRLWRDINDRSYMREDLSPLLSASRCSGKYLPPISATESYII